MTISFFSWIPIVEFWYQSMKMNSKLQLLALLSLSFAIGYFTTNFFTNRKSKPAQQNFTLSSSLVLVNQDGDNVDLLQVTDKMKIVYFGFIHCPDVCPKTLATFSTMLKANPDLSKKAKFYFISVDPERDSSQALQEYLNHFDNRIIGLTGDRIDIERTRKAFQAEAKTIRLPNKDYTVDHSVFIYILDKQNKIIAVYPSGTSGEILSKEIGKFFK